MARYCPLFSGSSGNCTYLGSRAGGLLVDAGVSFKRLREALQEREIALDSIRALLITHEHTDHVNGVKVLLKNCDIPVYATAGTLEALQTKGVLPPTARAYVLPDTLEVADMTVQAFHTPHDSTESCGFRVRFSDERSIAVATDMGYLTEEVKNAVMGCDLVHIESNHDVTMLCNGSYPYSLKCRVLGDGGHLSNERCAAFLPRLLENGTTRFVLAHLSRENNTPALARDTSDAALKATGAQPGRDYLLSVASPCGDTPVTIL